MRIILSLAALCLATAGASAQSYSHEPGTYRLGGTYGVVNSVDADSCAATCGQDDACLAWSFQRATEALGPARCELKQFIGRAEKNPLNISGVSPRFASSGQAASISTPAHGLLRGGPSLNTNPPVQNRPAIARPAPAPLRTPAAPRPTPVTLPPPAATPVRAIPALPPAPPLPAAPVAAPPPVPITPINVPTLPAVPTPPAPETTLPPGAVLRDAPPPDISFAPLDPVPASAPQISPPEANNVTIPKRVRAAAPEAPTLDTVPAGTTSLPPATRSTPYNKLRNRRYPNYTVSRDSVKTADDLEREAKAAEAGAKAAGETIVESLELETTDLATDIGQPVPTERGARSGGGGS